ncbi:MAG TPA: hypothetical protein VK191_08245 [Symbiobacteriaceae bacterium]|nr:hypothetical protein [Symbiobacteriaceae bacterium]
MNARIGLLLAALLLAGGALWVKFGGHETEPVTQPPPVVTPGQGQTGGQTGGNTQQPPSLEQQLKVRAAEILPLMKAGDLGALAAYVHPTKGLRFSPYVHSNPTDRLYQTAQLGGAMGDQTVVGWGSFDGSGEPMNLKFQAYWNRFVWDRDFTTSTQIAVDKRQGQGNSTDNTAATFPGAHWVEYYTPGTATYNGMDWASLRLVFEQHNGQWYLVAIVRDQWTI